MTLNSDDPGELLKLENILDCHNNRYTLLASASLSVFCV
jgi:hypothetical protein